VSGNLVFLICLAVSMTVWENWNSIMERNRDKDGIPTDGLVDRLRTAVEDIKTKMKRLQN
jgi:hypothetical protein